MKWWPWSRTNGKAAEATAAEARLRREQRKTRHVERVATERLANVSAEELNERMRRAMTIRHT